MNAQQIETILSELKVNSRGQIRNKSSVINKLQREVYKYSDNKIMNCRIQIAKLLAPDLKKVDDILYNESIKF